MTTIGTTQNTPAAKPTTPPGYRLGDPTLARSPVTLDELDLLRGTLLMGDDDLVHLRLAGEVVRDQIEDILDVWYGFVGANPHLVRYFSNLSDGKPNAEYLARVRARFGQWIVDTTNARYDQAWLDYQHEVGLRHRKPGKNATDGVASVPHIPLRYVLAFVMPLSATMTPFLAKKGHPPETVAKMRDAWTKAVLLTAILWSEPYVKDGEF
ncbi:protoglobin domain-containing protein [Sandaracinus amylolyticus]|nr:protoglobin domain-containing protein [Sandaracinus amylolyticus]